MAGLRAHSIDTVRIATFAAPLSRDGPGLLLRDIRRGADPQIDAITSIIARVAPDVLVLTDFDYDATGAALSEFAAQFSDPYPFLFTAQPNAGVQNGFDMDGDGFIGDARDALGYGRFLGDGGMAILSRYPIEVDAIKDLTGTLWRDVPGRTLPERAGQLWPSTELFDVLPLSSTAHWIVPVDVRGTTISLLAFDATAPVFDGPEDFNGLRNRDELRLFEVVLDGHLGDRVQRPILIGNANLDPDDGDGLRDGIRTVLARPDLQDPQPRSRGAQEAADPGHLGNPAFDTVDWPDDRPGNLRVSYILPSVDLAVLDTGVFWPASDDPLRDLFGGDGLAAGPHRLVWVDLVVDGGR